MIELSKNPDIQTKLRAELLEFGPDPTYDQLPNNLPYLDAVVHEALRMHAPLPDFSRMASTSDRKFIQCLTHWRQAAQDDVIPLSNPVRTRSGKLVDHLSVAKGTYVSVSIPSMNRSTALWGPDAKEFKPERWIVDGGIPAGAKEVQGHRHLLTFNDGPRACLGKGFAIAEFKVRPPPSDRCRVRFGYTLTHTDRAFDSRKELCVRTSRWTRNGDRNGERYFTEAESSR